MPLFILIMEVRLYTPADAEEVVSLFYETVHAVNKRDYTHEQLCAWAPQNISVEKWNKSLLANYTIVVVIDNVIAGFGDIDSTGYFDHLFVHKDFQSQGIAGKIILDIESYARNKCFSTIKVAASITAKPVFERYGYIVVKEQSVERFGQNLTNFLMEKKF